jgi:hypothetical protein
VPRLNLQCACGNIAWDLIERAPRTGVRYICHCDDCQAFACFTGSEAKILDSNGGTDAYQLPSSQIELHKGVEHLACVKMTSGRLLRWYCLTCRTPVANTYDSSKLSFVSVPLCGASKGDRNTVCGPPSGHVWTKFGWGDLSDVTQYSIPRMLWRMLSRIVRARFSGDYRNNPFFHQNGNPIAIPYSLSRAERIAVNASVDAANHRAMP